MDHWSAIEESNLSAGLKYTRGESNPQAFRRLGLKPIVSAIPPQRQVSDDKKSLSENGNSDIRTEDSPRHN